MAQGAGPSKGRLSLYPIFVIAYLALAATVGLANPYVLNALRLISFDSYQRVLPAMPAGDSPVRVIDIDEQSLQRIGQWPWPRSTIAQLTDALGQAGAAVVAFDMMFPEADRSSPEEIEKALPPDVSAVLAPLLQRLIPNDELLAQAMTRVPTVLGATLTQQSGSASPFPMKAGTAIAGDNPAAFLHQFPTVTGNLPALTAAARGIGALNWIPDRDQVVRRVPLVFRAGDLVVPSLAAEALRVAQGASTYVIKASNASGETAFGRASGINHIRIGAVEIPTDGDGGLWLRFTKVSPDLKIPAWRILSGAYSPDAISGRIILVGASASGLTDLRATSLDEAIPGVLVHAQILEHILSGQYLTRPDWASAAEIALMVVLGALLAIVFPAVGALPAAALAGVAIVLVNLSAWLAYSKTGLLFDPLYPSLCLFVLGTAASFFLYRRTEVQRQEIKRAFNHYVSPAVVRELIAHPEKLVLGGEIRQLTLMFCDVRSFTKISEGLTASQLTSFVNELLTPISEVILKSGGTIDKYMGDAVVAFWNAPLDDVRHAPHALEAARGILDALERLNVIWQQRAEAEGRRFPIVRVGIGVNTGECCVGNLGSIQRFDYSAIGDEVNVASRFEGLTKVYGVPVVTGEVTIAALGEDPALELDLVRVVGRAQPSRIFTLVNVLSLDSERSRELRTCHGRMLEAYRHADWAAAERAIGECRALGASALSPYYDLFSVRIAAFKVAPPPKDWDGVFNADAK